MTRVLGSLICGGGWCLFWFNQRKVQHDLILGATNEKLMEEWTDLWEDWQEIIFNASDEKEKIYVSGLSLGSSVFFS